MQMMSQASIIYRSKTARESEGEIVTNISKEIKLVNQDDDVSCSLACISMITGKNLSSVRMIAGEMGITAPCNNLEFLRILTAFKVLGVSVDTYDETMYENHLYKIVVPSLNSKRGTHAIIADTRHGELRIYDPQQDRKGKDFYTTENLKSWSSPIRIIDIYTGV